MGDDLDECRKDFAPPEGRVFEPLGGPVDAPPHGPPRLGFVCREYRGFEVMFVPFNLYAHFTEAELLDDRRWPRNADGTPHYHHPIKVEELLHDGMPVIWKGTPLDSLWCRGRVRKVAGGEFRVENEYACSPLEFGRDERGCWTSASVCNKRRILSADFS